jgi:MoxR-like ATPase
LTPEITRLVEDMARECYVADDALATAVYLSLRLDKPLLIEGPAGVGKTEVAKVLARVLGTNLIRLQCYEGLDAAAALYEWNYPRQLLHLKAAEGDGRSAEQRERDIFGEAYLLQRPLLRAIRQEGTPPVLLIDEVDRADEEFEAFLLEVLSDFQVTVPEIGTIMARTHPRVVLTSNRVRELSDALQRRCIYHWIDYPDLPRELEIVHARLPGIDERLAAQVCGFVQDLRRLPLDKAPGVAETLDWASALLALGVEELDASAVEMAWGSVLKHREDIERARRHLPDLLGAAEAGRDGVDALPPAEH